MKNSNIIHIALDWHKQEQKRHIARLLNDVTLLCKQKGIKWQADLATEIKIGTRTFPCTENGLERARNYVLNLNQSDLEMFK